MIQSIHFEVLVVRVSSIMLESIPGVDETVVADEPPALERVISEGWLLTGRFLKLSPPAPLSLFRGLLWKSSDRPS